MRIYYAALFFLSKESMTHKKIQKLCYYAQAWYLANYGEPLFRTNFEAWVHGPVSPVLYSYFRDWGWAVISSNKECPEIGEKEYNILEKVYEIYGKFSGEELEKKTHSEDPWINARAGLPSSSYSRRDISNEDMKKYYGARIGKTA